MSRSRILQFATWNNTSQALTHQEKAEQSLERGKQYISSREYKTVVLDEFGDTIVFEWHTPCFSKILLLISSLYTTVSDVNVVVTGHDPKPFGRTHKNRNSNHQSETSL
jgi:ATP:corrinoid adenosyltransferase